MQKVQGLRFAVGGINKLVHKKGEIRMIGVSRGSGADDEGLADVLKDKR